MTPAAFYPEETNSQHSHWRYHADFTHFTQRYSRLLTSISWVPPCSLPSGPTRAWDPHLEPTQASVAEWVQDASLDPYNWPALPCTLRANPSSCALAHHKPDTHHWLLFLCTIMWQDPAATEVHVDSQGPHTCIWARFRPVNSDWPALLGSPAVKLLAWNRLLYQ